MGFNKNDVYKDRADALQAACKNVSIYEQHEKGSDGRVCRRIFTACNRHNKIIFKLLYFNDVLDVGYSTSRKLHKDLELAEEVFYSSDGRPGLKYIYHRGRTSQFNYSEIYTYSADGGVRYEKKFSNSIVTVIINFDMNGFLISKEVTPEAVAYPGYDKTNYTPEAIEGIYKNSIDITVQETEEIIRRVNNHVCRCDCCCGRNNEGFQKVYSRNRMKLLANIGGAYSE